MAEQVTSGFAGLLRQLRAEARLTQQELAKAAAVNPRAVSDLERGINRTARQDTAVRLAGALGLAEPVRSLFIAAASRTAVSWRAVRLMPRSRSLTDRGLTPAALASSSCVRPAPARSCRSNPANPEVARSAMTAASPPHRPQPARGTQHRAEGLMP